MDGSGSALGNTSVCFPSMSSISNALPQHIICKWSFLSVIFTPLESLFHTIKPKVCKTTVKQLLVFASKYINLCLHCAFNLILFHAEL